MRTRRPRTFEDLYSKSSKKQEKQTSSVFDYEQLKEQSRSSEDSAKNNKRLMEREASKEPRRSYTEKKSSAYIIQKAREVPSAIHGTRKMKPAQAATEKETAAQKSGYRSSIIEEIKRERLKKQKRQANQQKKQRVKRTGSYIHTSPVHLNKSPKQSDVNDTEQKENNEHNVVKAIGPHNKQLQNEKKRVGPKFSYPALHFLGPNQNDNYEVEDSKVTEKIIRAFNAVAVPIEMINYQSNGMFGNYEMRVKSNLRIGQLHQLKTIIQPHMDDMHFRITTDKLSSGIINIEVPLIKKDIITFNTLFNASSLRMRKSDFKVVLGKTLQDRVFSFPLTKASHVLLYGGRDDSVKMVVDNIIISLFMNHTPYELKLHFITGKDTYKRYLDLPYAFDSHKHISSDDAFDSISNELVERQTQFRRAQVRNITSFNQRVGPQFKKSIILVVIDDLHTILREKNSYAYSALLQLLTKGKSLGIHLIVRQSDTSYDIRFELIRLLQTRVSFFDPMHRIINGAEELSEHRADCLVQLPTTSKPARITLGSVSERVLEDILTHIRTPKLS